jgi:glycosyltransferase involved in cell wall biosynthesis
LTGSRLRVLCLDIEGGFGGSSRSLFEALRHMDRDLVAPEVWCRRAGPIQARYQALGIRVQIEPTMPRFSALPTLSRNLIASAHFVRDFMRARQFRNRLRREVEARFDLVHFNHEGLFWLARWLRRRVRVPFSMHIRTNILPSSIARLQVRTIARVIDHRLFITENEEANYRRLGGSGPGAVIYNPISADAGSAATADPELVARGAFRIACMANFSHQRGIDRLAEIAAALRTLGTTDIHFVVAGVMRLTRSLPGDLGRVARAGGDLAAYVEQRGLGGYFTFLGHVSTPERVLASCQALIKPTRMNDPWGRDVIEAMAAEKPVISFGTWSGFIRHGETGLLFDRFEPETVARALVALKSDPGRLAAMGNAASRHILRICDGPARADELLSVWEGLAKRSGLAHEAWAAGESATGLGSVHPSTKSG